MRKTLRCLTVCALLFPVRTASADPVTIVRSYFSVGAAATAKIGPNPYTGESSFLETAGSRSAAAAVGDASAASLAQLTGGDLVRNSIYAVAFSSSEAQAQAVESYAASQGSASFSVILDVPSPHAFVFEGDYTVEGTEGSFWNWSTELRDWGEVEEALISSVNFGHFSPLQERESRIFQTGTLGPGVYLFSSGLQSAADRQEFANQTAMRGSVAFDVRLSFSELDQTPAPVPEPGSFLLLGTGLAGLWRLRQRSRS